MDPTHAPEICRVTNELSAEETKAFSEIARRSRLTRESLVQSLWALMLSGYAGSSDVIFGTVVAIRPPELAGIESIVGVLTNTLPTRVRLRDDQPFVRCAERLQEQHSERMDHATASLRDIQQWCHIHGQSEWLESIVVSEPVIHDGYAPSEVSHLAIRVADYQEWTGFPLALVVSGSSQLCMQFESDVSRISAELLSALASYFRRATRALIDEPDLSADELRERATEQNLKIEASPCSESSDSRVIQTIPGLFDKHVDAAPHRPAVVSGDEVFTYANVSDRSKTIAARLLNAGVGTGDIVGVSLSHSANLLPSLLGVMRAGAAFLPLDPECPPDRLAAMLDDAAPKLILTDEMHAEQLASIGVASMIVDYSSTPRTGARPSLPVINGTSLAYVIFTSGSTGRPKGIAVEHHSVVNLLEDLSARLQVSEADVFASTTSISFDISILELFLPLANGARVAMFDRDVKRDGRSLDRGLRDSNVTFMQGTPAYWTLLINSGWRGNDNLTVLTGGERLPVDLGRQLLQRASAVWNLYGPTEATIWCMAEPVGDSRSKISIGSPIAETRIEVLDSRGRRVPVMAPGELCIAGDCLARGYLNRPAETARRFLPDEFSCNPGTRIYRTGDIVRVDSAGIVEYLGRNDGQTKILGHRVEVAEIEAAIMEWEGADECVVLTVTDSLQMNSLAACISVGERNADEESVRRFLSQKLPGYMRPAQVLLRDRLPRTISGKVDTSALKSELAGNTPQIAQGGGAIQSIEQAVSRVWRETLRRDQIGSDQNFFDVGGNSLQLLGVFDSIREQIGDRGLMLVDLFRFPTIAAITEYISSLGNEMPATTRTEDRE